MTSLFQSLATQVDEWRQGTQTQEGRKAVALKCWETLNPDTFTYHVMLADTQLKDEGKKQVSDFILGI
jgi:hypothetical protein